MADARPVAVAVADRVIMVCSIAFWRAVIA
jgi:hypothetical protein